MSFNLGVSSDNLPDKDSGVSKIGEGAPTEAQGSSGTEKSDAPATQPFPNPIDAEVNVVAMQEFDKINEGARLQVVSKMFIPEGKSPIEGVNYHRISTKVDTFRILSKEGFYQKWIKAVSESTKKELELERQENRLKKYRSGMKDRFLDYLKHVQEKGNGGSAPAR